MTENTLIAKGGSLLVLTAALLACFLPVFYFEYWVLHHTNGVFIYPVDDAFIHLQLSKNLAQHHNWGINVGEFNSASSSPFYTVLLSLLGLIFSSNILIPFLVNCVAAVALLVVVQSWLKKQGLGNLAQLVILLCIVFFLPLPVLVVSGMEHVLQCLFSFLFLTRFCSWLFATDEGAEQKGRVPGRLVLYGMLMVSTRYEGLFLLAMCCLVLLFYRRLKTALLLGFLSCIPIILFGIYSVARGSYFLPNSILVKSEAAQFSLNALVHSLGNILIQRFLFAFEGVSLLATQKILLLLVLVYLVMRKPGQKESRYSTMVFVIAGTCLLHIAFADTGKFYRYEAYLIFLATVSLGVVFYYEGKNWLRGRPLLSLVLLGLIGFLLLLPVGVRSVTALSKTRQACINIYEQQYQMGQFLKKYYNTSVVAANDIGAVSYFTKDTIVDLWGLATIEVARSRKGNYWTADFLDRFCKAKRVKLALIYDSWIGNSIPQHWQKLATWRIQNNVVCGDDTVSFYAVEEGSAPELLKNLQDFQSALPSTVQVAYGATTKN